jgi:N-acetylglutamate synthase-like GNAT family acetyltransferase
MTSRVLPVEEWDRLVGTEADVCRGLDPAHTHVLVVEDSGAIVGTWALTRVVHAECLWIREDHRKRGGVGRRLLALMRSGARAMGAGPVWTGAMSDEVRMLIEHFGGTRVPGDSYLLPMRRARCQPQS